MKGIPKEVFISEDGTAIVPKAEYNSKRDRVSGLVYGLDEKALPIPPRKKRSEMEEDELTDMFARFPKVSRRHLLTKIVCRFY